MNEEDESIEIKTERAVAHTRPSRVRKPGSRPVLSRIPAVLPEPIIDTEEVTATEAIINEVTTQPSRHLSRQPVQQQRAPVRQAVKPVQEESVPVPVQQTVSSRQQVNQDIVQTETKPPVPVRHMQRQPIQREQIDALPSPAVVENRPIFEEPAAAISQAQGEITKPRDSFTNDATALSRLAGIPTQGQVQGKNSPEQSLWQIPRS